MPAVEDPGLARFFEENPDFDLLAHDFFAPEGPSLVLESEQTLSLLSAHQRLLRLGIEDSSTAQALIAAGLDSAHAIAGRSERRFLDEAAVHFSGPQAARDVHRNAVSLKEKLANLWATLRHLVASPHSRAHPFHNISPATTAYFTSFPSYRDLFGDLDYLLCPDCRSVLSPSAYFTDLMRVTEEHVTYPNRESIPPGMRLEERRPDLFDLELTCASADTVIPFLRLVNKVLLMMISPYLALPPPRALAVAPHPFNLPRLQPLERARQTLELLGANLAEIFTTLPAPLAAGATRHATSMSVTLAPSASTVEGAYVGMSLHLAQGADHDRARTIAAYDGATRVAIVETPFTAPPPPGSPYRIDDLIDPARERLGMSLEEYRYLTHADPSNAGVSRAYGYSDVELQLLPFAPGEGTVTFAASAKVLIGTGTDFAVLAPGDRILTARQERTVVSIETAQRLTVDEPFTVAATQVDYQLALWRRGSVAVSITKGTRVLSAGAAIVGVNVGDQIQVAGEVRTVLERSSATVLEVASAWGVDAANVPFTYNPATLLERLPVLLERTGLQRDGLLELLGEELSSTERSTGAAERLFVNATDEPALPALALHTERLDPDGPYERILGLSLTRLERISRFVRLSAHLEASYADVNWIIGPQVPPKIDAASITAAAAASRLCADTGRPLALVGSWWQEMRTLGRVQDARPQSPFDLVYNPLGLLDGRSPYTGPEQTPFDPSRPLEWQIEERAVGSVDALIRGRLRSALKLSDEELTALALLVRANGGGRTGALRLDLGALSWLHRIPSQASAFAVALPQFLILLRLLYHPREALPTTAAIPATIAAAEQNQAAAAWLRSSPLTAVELLYVLSSDLAPSFRRGYSDSDLRNLVNELAASVGPLRVAESSLLAAGLLGEQAGIVFAGLLAAGVLSPLGIVLDRPPTFALAAGLLPVGPEAFLTAGLIDAERSRAAYRKLEEHKVLEAIDEERAALSQSFTETTELSYLFSDEPARAQEMRASVRSTLLLVKAQIEGILGVLEQATAAQESTAVQGLAAFLDLAQDMVPAAALFTLGREALARERGELLTPLPPTELVPEGVRTLVDRLARTGLWTGALGLQAPALRRIAALAGAFGFADALPRGLTLANLQTLTTYLALAARARSDAVLLDYFEDPQQGSLARAMNWPADQLAALSTLLWPSDAGPPPEGPGTVTGVAALAEAFDLSERLGADPVALSALLELRQLSVGEVGGTVKAEPWERLEAISNGVLDMLAARHPPEELTATLADAEARSDGALRDALLPFTIWTLGRVHPELGIRDAERLYEYLLLDVQMTPAASTSLIAQGISSVQLYLQRARANLEPGVETLDIDPVWWRWLPSYRMWEANRSIFLYPENYLHPGLRSDQTPLFADLVGELLQSELNETSATDGLTDYFNGLAGLANLSICGTYNHHQQRPSGAREVLHVLGRARTEPYEFFLRSHDTVDGWSPWRKVELSIASPSAVPIVAFDRLFLFWAELSTSKSANVHQEGNDAAAPQLVTEDRSVAEASIKYSFQDIGGRWVQPQILAERIPTSVAPDEYPPVKDPRLEPYLDDDSLSYRQPYPLRVERGLVGKGRVKIQAGTRTLLGSGTAFERQVEVQDRIYCAGQAQTVLELKSDSELICAEDWMSTVTNAEFKVIPRDPERNGFPPFKGAGLVSAFAGGPNVFGTGTAFQAEIAVGDRLIVGGQSRTVRFVSSDVELVVDPNWSTDHSNQEFRVIPGEVGQERLIVLFGEALPTALAVELVKPTPMPNPGRDQFVKQHNTYNDSVFGALLSARATRDAKLRGVVTVTSAESIDSDLNVQGGRARLLDYGANCVGAPRPFRPVLDWAAATIRVARSDDALADNYWGNSAAGVATPWPPGSGFDLLFDISRSHSSLSNVGNQPGWFVFDNGDESFLVRATQPRLGRLSQMTFVRALSTGEPEAGLSLTTAPYTTAPVSFEQLSFQFMRLSTSVIGQLQQRLLANGVDGLLTIAAQRATELPFKRFYLNPEAAPPSHVLPPASETLDFDGAYGVYFQEVFLFTPWLVAERLRADQQYEAAREWLHHIFDPTERDEGDGPDRFWRYLPFRDLHLESIAKVLNDKRQIAEYNDHPFDPDAIARLRPGAYAKAVVLGYLGTLLDWADALFARDTRESIDQASQLYVLVSGLLGPRPTAVGTVATPKPLTFREIHEHYGEDIPQFLIDLENAAPGIAALPALPYRGIPFNDVRSYFCVPENRELNAYWDRVEDRLFKIRNLLSLQGVARPLALFEAPLDVRALAASGALPAGAAGFAPPPNHRFAIMIEQAREAAGLVAQFGSSLLGALERRDAEALAQLQVRQQRELLEQTTLMKERQVDEAAATAQALAQGLAGALARREYYDGLIQEGLSSEEVESLDAMAAALVFNTLAQVANTAAAIGFVIPQLGSPFAMTYGGQQLGNALQTGGRVLQIGSDIATFIAQRSQTMAGYTRREQEWQVQATLASIDEQQVTAEILANDARQELVLRDLEAHRSTIAQTLAMERFLAGKFTNEQLYDWLVTRLGGLYFQLYQLACELARGAERAYQYELGSSETFVEPAYWDRLRRGLLAGEGLSLSLARMQSSYLEASTRPLEIQRSISLLALEPKALLDLRARGECTFALSERLFDFDFPGHYRRRIKTIAISIPAVFGPYQSIKATLTQLSNQVVLEPELDTVKFLLGEESGVPPASRLRWNWRLNQQIAISRAVADAGLFELAFEDPRYLPFEGTGAVSSWKLSMPPAANRFAFSSIADVILDLRYTALDGGAGFRREVTGLPALREYSGEPLLDLAQQHADAWFAFMSDHADPDRQAIAFRVPATVVPAHVEAAVITGFTFLLIGPKGGRGAGSTDAETPYITLGLTSEALFAFALTSSDTWTEQLDVPLPASDLLAQEQSIAFDLGHTPTRFLENGYLDPARISDIALVLHIRGTINWS